MSHPQIVIPFGLPPAGHARDLIRQLGDTCGKDGLAMLLARPDLVTRQQHEDFARMLPHERWISSYCPPLQALLDSQPPQSAGCWFLLTPVHLHVAPDHLVLADYRRLDLREDEAMRLFDIAERLCDEQGMLLKRGDRHHWLLRADQWADLDTATPDAACGHNIDIWSPHGTQARAWRKLQNEIQMEWHADPVQEQRQQRSASPVNSLWLWSGTRVQDIEPKRNGILINPAAEQLAPDTAPAVLDWLCEAALAEDWSGWLEGMQRLERDWFRPLVRQVRGGRLRRVDLVLSNSNTLLHTEISSRGLKRFWRRPDLKLLAAA